MPAPSAPSTDSTGSPCSTRSRSRDRPESGFFDPLSNPADRALYVTVEGKSVLRVGGIPAPPPLDEPPVYDLMEFAAILEP
jgi:hypothetical protein